MGVYYLKRLESELDFVTFSGQKKAVEVTLSQF